jgi:hypothetical protein
MVGAAVIVPANLVPETPLIKIRNKKIIKMAFP